MFNTNLLKTILFLFSLFYYFNSKNLSSVDIINTTKMIAPSARINKETKALDA